MSTAVITVPCGIHTCVPGTKDTVACGGTCQFVKSVEGINYFRCDRCLHVTSRYTDGKPLPAWDGILRDGTPYEGSCVDEHHWTL